MQDILLYILKKIWFFISFIIFFVFIIGAGIGFLDFLNWIGIKDMNIGLMILIFLAIPNTVYMLFYYEKKNF